MGFLRLFRRSKANTVKGQPAYQGKSPFLVARQQEEDRYLEWFGHQQDLIGRLPWFGERISPVRARGSREKGQALTVEDEERVLLSWLAGGSRSQMAVRAGVSRRTVYNLVHRVIYETEPQAALFKWYEAGLYACMSVPRFELVSRSGNPDLVCLICHQSSASTAGLPIVTRWRARSSVHSPPGLTRHRGS